MKPGCGTALWRGINIVKESEMKKLLLVFLVFFCVSPSFSRDRAPGTSSKNQPKGSVTKGPFGFTAGMKKKQIAALVGGEAKLKPMQNNTYSVEMVPNPSPLFETYSLYIDPNLGLTKIIAWSKPVVVSGNGTEIKEIFKGIGASVNDDYGKGEKYDYLKVGSTLRDPEDWMAGLLKKERVLASYWLKKNIGNVNNNISAITLEAVALSQTKGVLFLSYEFEEPQALSN
jgi:hypothetical protein